MKFTYEEIGTLLAALVHWNGHREKGDRLDEMDLATDEETLIPLTSDEIDLLCARLNTEGAE